MSRWCQICLSETRIGKNCALKSAPDVRQVLRTGVLHIGLGIDNNF